MNLKIYLKILNEQTFGVQPALPTQVPQPSTIRSVNMNVSAPQIPVSPQIRKQRVATGQGKGHGIRRVKVLQPKKNSNPVEYFNYMIWTANIIKQSEIFRKNCYNQNCSQYEVGTGDRSACKNRCDIETCKKIISMLKTSTNKCDTSSNPDKCKIRYLQLIQLYQEKLNEISRKFIKAETK